MCLCDVVCVGWCDVDLDVDVFVGCFDDGRFDDGRLDVDVDDVDGFDEVCIDFLMVVVVEKIIKEVWFFCMFFCLFLCVFFECF